MMMPEPAQRFLLCNLEVLVIRQIEQLARMIGPMGWLLLGGAGILALSYVLLMGCLIGPC